VLDMEFAKVLARNPKMRSDVNSGHESLMQQAAFHRTVVQRQQERESLT